MQRLQVQCYCSCSCIVYLGRLLVGCDRLTYLCHLLCF
uniref:Uncharacterized protein n=1 Tax=Anguilla anguilla TaxID=7936 RepID=A0A0E9PK43_ANGAN